MLRGPLKKQMPVLSEVCMRISLPFLTARWRNLIVLNFEVEPTLLEALLPVGLELDLFEGKALVSVIAFHFDANKLFGKIPTIPVTQFEELNLRFYVRRLVGDEVRRGVVFVKEVVPSFIIATTARLLYGEPYEVRSMSHDWSGFSDHHGGTLRYTTRVGREDVTISADTAGDLLELGPHSVQEFILEHYWGYTKQNNGSISEYRVEHEPWRYWSAAAVTTGGDLWQLYPAEMRPFLCAAPHSVFVARGSPVAVYGYKRFYPICNTEAFPDRNRNGYLLYDGGCGFCSWLVRRCEVLLKHAGFGIASLQTSWVRDSLRIADGELTRDIRLMLREGTLLSGADAYLHLMSRMRWIWPLGLLLSLPGMRWLTWRIYERVNRNRFMISRICKLSPEGKR